jgi:tetratricopeptide (TPR) repeat protein
LVPTDSSTLRLPAWRENQAEFGVQCDSSDQPYVLARALGLFATSSRLMLKTVLGRFDDAERAYLDAVKRDPLLFGAYNNLAFMAAQRKVKLDEALAWARKANELAPGVATVRDTLGWVQRARGELPAAARSIEEAVQLAPNDPAIRYHLGVVYAELGRKADAAKSLKRALELNPDFRQAEDARRRLNELGAK